MKSLRLLCTLLALLTAAGAAPAAPAADHATVRAILVAASNTKGETDRRLAAYEPTLRRILRFESYRFLGEGSANLGVPAAGRLNLGRGHTLELATESADGPALRVKVRWTGEGRTLMNTGLALRPGVPAVLGGPANDRGEVYAVILIGR